ncbi:type II toxin-antitoxin system VapB family antitoxin [Methylocaldum gracile]|uniref:type II toxin-antitoxin system VapB family antitoxin n=1 Tax=Methylocaldum sp. 0917 TaxID=2485163 RepID=UPI001AAC9DAD
MPSWYFGPPPRPVHARPGLTWLVAAPGHPCPGLTRPIFIGRVNNDEQVREAFKYSDAKTKRELVERALREFVANRKRKDVRDLIATVEIDPNYDSKTLRAEQS